MEKQTKPAPDAAAHLAALRCARASLLLASLRRPRAPPPPQDLRRSSSSFSSSAAAARSLSCQLQECAPRSKGLLHGSGVAAARREAAGHARIAGSELLLVLAVAPAILLLLLLLGVL
ncbi:unnamed protein product [Urochloa humidicola]